MSYSTEHKQKTRMRIVEAGVDPSRPSPIMARRMIDGYLSVEHLDDLDGQCPMIAREVRAAAGATAQKMTRP